MEAKVVAAVGGCALLAGVAYIFQGESKPKKTEKEESDLFPGLVNLGNTCYLNSVLQALASVSSFVSWLSTSSSSEYNSERETLTSKLSKLMQILNNPCYEQESYNPVSVFKSLYSYGWVISWEQQDAHEIFQVLTSTLADENDCVNDKISDDSIVHRSRVTASKIKKKSCSPFTGLFANQLSCKTCSKKYPVKFDHFDTISLSLPTPFQVLESFECSDCDQLLQDEKNKNERKKLLKKLSLGKLPPCLCFHINRTYWQDNGTPFKNNTFVNFSEILDIEPFLYSLSDINLRLDISTNFKAMFPAWCGSEHFRKQELIESDRTKDSNLHSRFIRNTQYQLAAVIVHLGGVFDGHYVTYRKTGTSENTRWTLASDEKVQTVSISTVLESNAYMLFYERHKA